MAIVARLRDLLVQHAEDFAQLITEEMGCPISQSRAIQVPNPVGILDAYLDVAATYPFREVRQSRNGQALVTREPVGVVAAIVPWNVPLVTHDAEDRPRGVGGVHRGAQALAGEPRWTLTCSPSCSTRPVCRRGWSTLCPRTARSASTW